MTDARETGLVRTHIAAGCTARPLSPQSLSSLVNHKAQLKVTASLTSTAVDLSVHSDANVAWRLVDVVNAHLTGHERRMVFVELGCGEEYLAIKRMLAAVLSGRMPMPGVILDTVTRWLDGYSGNPEEPPLRTVLAEIRAQQSVRVEADLSVEQSECRPRAADGQPARLGIAYA